jgi:hypothetical protein
VGKIRGRKERRAQKEQAVIEANQRFAERGLTGVRALIRGDKFIVQLEKPGKVEEDL